MRWVRSFRVHFGQRRPRSFHSWNYRRSTYDSRLVWIGKGAVIGMGVVGLAGWMKSGHGVAHCEYIKPEIQLVDPELIAAEVKHVKIPEEKIEFRTIIELIWEIIKQNPLLFLGSVVIGIFSQALPLALPWGVGKFLDTVRTCQEPKELILPTCCVLGFGLATGLLDWVQYSLITSLCAKLHTLLSKELYSSFIRQNMDFFDRVETSDLVPQLDSDVTQVVNTFKHCVTRGLSCGVSLVGGVGSLYLMSQKLSLVMFAGLPVMVGIGSLYSRILRSLSASVREEHNQVVASAYESLGLIRTVRMFAKEDDEIERFNESLECEEALASKFGIGVGFLKGMTKIGFSAILGMVLGYGGYLVLNEQLTTGLISGFLYQSFRLQGSLAELSILGGEVSHCSSVSSRLNEILLRKPTIPLKGGIIIDGPVEGTIELNHVTFSYPSRPSVPVVKDLSMIIPAGKIYALVGPSGSGKSTIVSLIERFYDPTKGSIHLDGVNVKDLDVSWLHKQVGIVNQEPSLFDCSILENIRYGLPEATLEDVIRASKQANCHQFIEHFPDGYHTSVGERGVQLSGGQKQRIAIARALLLNPKILILDEATSALDSESEILVQQALDRVMTGRTVIIVAHRLSTIRKADCILVLKNGQIVERGTHKELLHAKGIYATQVASQIHGWDDDWDKQ